MKRRILTMVLALFCFLSCLTSCGDDYVIEYGNTGLTEGMYHYMYASMKQYYLDTYSDIEDTEEFWAQNAANDQSYAEYFDERIKEAICDFVISAELFDTRGNTVDSEGQEQIDAVYEDAVLNFGSEKALSAALATMGATTDELKAVYTLQYKYERMLYDSGIAQADDESREEYYQNRYFCLKVIYVATEKGYLTDDDGNKLVGEDGYYKMYDLAQTEREAKLAKADALEQSLADGSTVFEEAYADSTVNELDISYYPNGMYICADTPYTTGLTAVSDAAFTLQIGEHTRVQDVNGEYFVLRCNLPDKAYEDETDYLQFSGMDEMVARYQFRELMEELLPGLVSNEKVVNSYSISTVNAVTY